MPRSLDMWLG